MTMTDNRRAGWAGVLFVALLNAVLFAPGAPPKANQSAASIAASLSDDRTLILGGTFVAGLAAIFAIWFFTAIPGWVRSGDGSHDGAATAAAGGGLFAVMSILVGLLLFFGATFDATVRSSLPTVRALTDAGNATIEMSKFGTVLFVAGLLAATRGTDVLPRPMRLWGAVAIPIALASAVALFSRGDLTQFGGPLDLLGGGPAVAWILAVAVVQILRSAP
jgi:hypothetical protein